MVVTTWLWSWSTSSDNPKSETFALKFSSKRCYVVLYPNELFSACNPHANKLVPLQCQGRSSFYAANQATSQNFCEIPIYLETH